MMRITPQEVAAKVEPIMARYGLKPVPMPADQGEADGYAGAFQGPSIRGKYPCIAVLISELDLLVAQDIGQVDELIKARTDVAVRDYQEMLAEGPH
jgi:hypothetical protein